MILAGSQFTKEAESGFHVEAKSIDPVYGIHSPVEYSYWDVQTYWSQWITNHW